MSNEITIYNSPKELKLQKINELSQLAINRLTGFNKSPLGDKYELAIQELVKYILFYTNKEKVIAFPMSTGSGKK